MPKTQIRQQIQALDIADAQVAAAAAIATTKLADGPNFLKRDGSVTWTAFQNGGGFRLTNIADPTANTDAVTKQYVDSVASGLDPKASVRAASTANIANLAGGTPNALDGVTLVLGDRVLVKDQTTANQNGIYTVTALGTGVNGTWTRATDLDSTAEYTSGAHTFVEEGTTQADTGWVVATDGPIVVGTTPVQWVQFSGTGQITAGAGMTKTGNTLDIVATDASILIAADSLKVQYDPTANNIELGTAGIRQKRGTSAQICVCNAAGDPTNVTMSGDATIANTGAITLNVVPGAGMVRNGLNFDVVALDASLLVGANDVKVQYDTTAANIELGTNGIRIKRGTIAGQIWVANGVFDAAPVVMSGDATITATGVITVNPATVMKPTNFIINETPAGTMGGGNMIFTLASAPVLGKEQVYLNGLLQKGGGGTNDYSIAGATITFTATAGAPLGSDTLLVSYIK